MKYFSSDEKKILLVWACVGVIIFVFILGFKFIYLDKKDDEEVVEEEYKIVTNYDRYYTVMGAINKYYAFYNSKSYENILHILNSEYVKKNNINVDNIEEFITSSDVSLSYKGSIMCSKTLAKGLTSYIVSGLEVEMNSRKELDNKYYNVILDGNEFIFSIEPIDSEFYGGNCNG